MCNKLWLGDKCNAIILLMLSANVPVRPVAGCCPPHVVTGPITWATHNNIISATTGAQDKIAFTVLIPVYSTSCG